MSFRFSQQVLRRSILAGGLALSLSCLSLRAEPVQRIAPAPASELPATQITVLKQSLRTLGRELDSLSSALAGRQELLDLIPDARIFHIAVERAVEQSLFYNQKNDADYKAAITLLREGMDRAKSLKAGKAPWTSATGLVVRGYVSKLDGSIQPYGLEIPSDFKSGSGKQHRLDLWYHGRDDKLSELKFLNDRSTKKGQFQPPSTFVLHPYGRFCNANKLAGEVDTFEALDHALAHYPLDPARVSVRGFSMGGAATWHIAAHHAGRWSAAAPGAGFAETAEYQNIWAKEPKPTWYEQKLWNWTDATVYAGNLFHCPTVAYSGEEDKQMQAADIMARFMKQEGLELKHIIGPGMGHKYHPDSKVEIEKLVSAWAAQPKNPVPQEIRFTTYTLRYPDMHWVHVEGLGEHWKRADVRAQLDPSGGSVQITTTNVTALKLAFASKDYPWSTSQPSLEIQGQRLQGPARSADGSWEARLRLEGNRWTLNADKAGLAKRPGLQGPIDDAFMDSFLFVLPTGPGTGTVDQWLADEAKDAIYQWTLQFRGEPRVKRDVDVTLEDMKNHHLILWGTPASNRILGDVLPELPVEWSASRLQLAGKSFDAERHVPVMIYPNPRQSDRYVVLNSGFTFAIFGNQSNSTQVPKLPDYAVIDIQTPRKQRFPGGVREAGFFDEQWKIRASR